MDWIVALRAKASAKCNLFFDFENSFVSAVSQSVEMHQDDCGSRLYFSRAASSFLFSSCNQVLHSYVTLVVKALRKAMGFHISFLSWLKYWSPFFAHS